MSIFKDKDGTAGWMRRISYMLIITAIVWGSAEFAVKMIYAKYEIVYAMNTTLISTVFGMGLAGKVGQKFTERKQNKDV